MKPFKKIKKIINGSGGMIVESGEDGFACQLFRPNCKKTMYVLYVIASWGEGWDHVSIHVETNDGTFTPFWEDMAYIKDVFFKTCETVVQYHPAREFYVNTHEHTLHLWRQQGVEVTLPPQDLV